MINVTMPHIKASYYVKIDVHDTVDKDHSETRGRPREQMLVMYEKYYVS